MVAPIIVTVYNRFDHFKKCIECLLECREASSSEIYIVSDGAYREEDRKIINSIREYANEIKGFKKINKLFWNENMGSFNSVNTAIKKVLETNDSFIFLEDDIVVNEDFLHYLNNGLEFYKDDKRIFSISAYAFPIKRPKNYELDIYTSPRFNAWGFATWKNRWESMDWNLSDFDEFIKNKSEVKSFNKVAVSTLPVLLLDRKGTIKATDIRISYNMFRKKLLTIYPFETKTINNGFDGTGEHCGKVSKEKNPFTIKMEEKKNSIVFKENIDLDNSILKEIRKYSFEVAGGKTKYYIRKVANSFPFVLNIYKIIRSKLNVNKKTH